MLSLVAGLLFVSVFLLPGCSSVKPRGPSIPQSEVEALLPASLEEKKEWAEEIVSAIELIERAATTERACAVIAIISQESGFQMNPEVKNLPEIVRRALEKKFARLGPMAGVAVSSILNLRAPGSKETFKEKIKKLKTESDLDRLFRDIQGAVRERFPGPVVVASLVSKLMGNGWLEDLNPVTTLGPMQVKVAYAKNLKGMTHFSDGELRDFLYTRKGGVRAGVARLLDYEAQYDDVRYRFADYNAGVYSSRNAAFQNQISDLTPYKLVSDGDLLAYGSGGGVVDKNTDSLKAIMALSTALDLSERTLKHDAHLEKTLKFEQSDLWRAVRTAWKKKTGREPHYAAIPQVTLHSPKMSHPRTTEWFVKSVRGRYEQCRARGK